MKSVRLAVITGLLLSAVIAYAAQGAFTGSDYLKLSGAQRAGVVKEYKALAKQEGVTIKKDDIFYCKKLDSLYAKHPDMQKENFKNVLKTLVIMEYDWSQKGVDKDALAKQWLGDAVYKANKTRVSK